VKALRDEVDVPIHFHTHDTSGINAGSILRASDAGVDIADAALSSMSGTTSQPNLNSLVAAVQNTPRASGLDFNALNQLSAYWERVREIYYPFEEGLKAGSAEVYFHEMPGGQFTNLKQQAKSLGWKIAGTTSPRRTRRSTSCSATSSKSRHPARSSVIWRCSW
jgi:pyruvate carboxylase